MTEQQPQPQAPVQATPAPSAPPTPPTPTPPSLVEREHELKLHERLGVRPPHCRGCHGDQAIPLKTPTAQELDAVLPMPAPRKRGHGGPLPAVSSTGAISLGEALSRLQASGHSFAARVNEPTPETTEEEQPPCANCGGLHWLRQDVPVGHPEFGRLLPCPACNRPLLLKRTLGDLLEGAHVPELYRSSTFDNFPLTERSRPAYEQIKAWWEKLIGDPEHAQPALYLQGETGVGKTSMAAAIANAWSSWQAELTLGTDAIPAPADWVSEPDLLDAIRGTFNRSATRTAEQIKHAVASAPLLIIDELGGAQYTMWVAEQLLSIVEARYTSRLPTVITTNCSIPELEYLLTTMASKAEREDEQAMIMAEKRARRILWRILGMSQRIEMDGENLRDHEVRLRLGLGFLGAQLPLPIHHIYHQEVSTTPTEDEPDSDSLF